jgi:TPR repeat protein
LHVHGAGVAKDFKAAAAWFAKAAEQGFAGAAMRRDVCLAHASLFRAGADAVGK